MSENEPERKCLWTASLELNVLCHWQGDRTFFLLKIAEIQRLWTEAAPRRECWKLCHEAGLITVLVSPSCVILFGSSKMCCKRDASEVVILFLREVWRDWSRLPWWVLANQNLGATSFNVRIKKVVVGLLMSAEVINLLLYIVTHKTKSLQQRPPPRTTQLMTFWVFASK